ncbi:MAG: hypothetical protein GXP02_01195 [Alphaproteobacteria bacterium]|nr:hypothetical protein [Alphaproteobacteria bacterium]
MPVFVNKREITDDEVHAEMINHPAPDIDAARLDAARALVVRHLLLAEAVEQEIITAPEINALDEQQSEGVIRQLLDRIITTPEADAATCQRYYDQHQARFTDKKTDRILPYALVETHIIQYLEDKAFHAAFNAYLDTLMARAEIIGLAA